MISLTIDRTSLSLAPLVISDNPFGANLWLPEDALTWPVFDTRYLWAPDSNYEPGRTLLAAVKGNAEPPLTIYAGGDTTAELETAKAELAAAVAQWSYDLTFTVDAIAHAYNAVIVLDLPWGPVDSGMARAHMARTSFSIPLNP